MSKAIMFCGRDGSGIIKPINVDSDGKIILPYSYTTDDYDNKVLRIVDAAPFEIEYGMYSTLTGNTMAVAPLAAKALNENADRKYASIYNDSSAPIMLSATANGSGIVIAPGERYDMNAPKGTLYLGEMYLRMLNTESQTVTEYQQGGIGNSGFNPSSATRTHTDYIPVTVTSDGLAVSVSVSSSIASIRNVAAFNTNHELEVYEHGGLNKFPLADGEYSDGSFVVTNTAVKYIAVSFCKASHASDSLSVSDMSGTTLTVMQALPSTAYVSEGE